MLGFMCFAGFYSLFIIVSMICVSWDDIMDEIRYWVEKIREMIGI